RRQGLHFRSLRKPIPGRLSDCRSGAEPRADATERELGIRRGSRGVAEVSVRSEAAPFLVAAVQQIETDGAWNDRNERFAYLETAAPLGKPGLNSAAGLEPERRAARERDGIDLFNHADRIEQRVFACAGTAATDVDCGNGRSIENDRGHP